MPVMRGLDPRIHDVTPSHQLSVEVIPLRVALMDQPHLPRPRPMLDVFLSLNGSANVVMTFDENQPLQAMSLAKAFCNAVTMLLNPTRQIGGHANIKRAIGPVRHDVNPTAGHGAYLTR